MFVQNMGSGSCKNYPRVLLCGLGWSYPNLRNIRQFYIVYAKRLNSGYPFDVKNANQWLANSKKTIM